MPYHDKIPSHSPPQIPGISQGWRFSSPWHKTCLGIHELGPTEGKQRQYLLIVTMIEISVEHFQPIILV